MDEHLQYQIITIKFRKKESSFINYSEEIRSKHDFSDAWMKVATKTNIANFQYSRFNNAQIAVPIKVFFHKIIL
ncbi:hypothetical protein NG54_15790 [Heyndrickxia ginsengihumi]|uniref:Uncharacterized protein n=1 Tax=Heyndrickxia ginsengihumi TaxID=363870 RepID=A0A0A6VA51_9BACI|nr:hypothetical protein NG54_15790 [Heyndrickxia ginsengihumi]